MTSSRWDRVGNAVIGAAVVVLVAAGSLLIVVVCLRVVLGLFGLPGGMP